MIDDRTTNLNLPLPNAANLMTEDVERLRQALSTLDTQVFSRLLKSVFDAHAAAKNPHGATAADVGALSSSQVVPASLIPKATAASLGGIKVGSGLTILADGTLSNGGSQATFTEAVIAATSAGQTAFTVPGGYTPGYIKVSLNGVELNGGGDDYTASNGTSVTLTTGAAIGDSLKVTRFTQFSVATHVLKTGDTMSGPLVLPGSPTAPLEAAPKQYVDARELAAKDFAEPALPVGTVLAAPQMPTKGTWLPTDASIYLQASYPLLYSRLGLVADQPGAMERAFTGVSLSTSKAWASIAYGNGKYVAVGTGGGAGGGGAVILSGTNLTQQYADMPSYANWSSVIFAAGKFVAVAKNSAIAATSTDGVTWTQRTLPSSAGWGMLEYGNGVFVTIAGGLSGDTSSNKVAVSADGITWTAATLPSTTIWGDVVFGNGVFVAISQGSASATSTDGVTWTLRSIPSASGYWYRAAFGNGIFLAVSRNQETMVSADGVNWTLLAKHSFASQPADLVFGAGVFWYLPVGLTSTDNFTSIYTRDGIVWKNTSPFAYGNTSPVYTGACFGDGRFIGVNNNNYQFQATPKLITYNTTTQFAAPYAEPPLGMKSWIKAAD